MVDLLRSVRSVDASFLSLSAEETAFPSKVVDADTSISACHHIPTLTFDHRHTTNIQPDASCPCAQAR